MVITLNGENETFQADALTVGEMLKLKAWSFPLIVVKVDGRLVARADWDRTTVRDGDVVEAAHLMSGG